ncbi:MAG: VWA domain-containing protein [Desulfobacteraceae bacterium]|nr:VWA domain-containing protein [Desulfobacteraceae bacterium]
MRIFWGVVILFFAVMFSSAYAEPGDGSCTGYYFDLKSQGSNKIDSALPLRVINQNAKVYKSPGSSRISKKLDFGDTLQAVRISTSSTEGRIQVKRPGTKDFEELGWMERNDLLCADRPLKTEEGLEKKIFIRTMGTSGKSPSSVPAYFSSSGTKDNNELSRFELYFIFSEDKQSNRYLLAQDYSLSHESPLMGWVNRESGILWNTTLALRPADHVRNTWIYPNLETAYKKDKKIGWPVIGNYDSRWYTFKYHIPILDKIKYKEKEFYYISAPTVAVEAKTMGVSSSIGKDSSMFKKISILDDLGNFKHVDVFFLVDGTKSMQPYINETRKAVRNIAKTLTEKQGWLGTTLRFGFRVYRDDYACDKGICEGLPFSTSDCGASISKQNSWENFEKKFMEVTATEGTFGDDYWEALCNGLRQALLDIQGCLDHPKLLFVIGDCGDNESKTVPKDIIDTMNIFPRFVPVIIQTEDLSKSRNLKKEYKNAYRYFEKQGYDILKNVLPKKVRNRKVNYKNNFLTLNNVAELRTQIKKLEGFSSSAEIEELKSALEGGMALNEYIDKRMEKGDLPILYWKWVENLGDKLGEQSTKRIYYKVTHGYIPISNEWVEEFWLKSKDLEKWLHILKNFRSLEGVSGSDLRRRFVNTLVDGIQQFVGLPQWEDTNETPREYISKRKYLLPIRENSPLMQYTHKELMEDIPECEMWRLVNWCKSINSILSSVYAYPKHKASFMLKRDSSRTCLNMSRKGKNIHIIKKRKKSMLAGEDFMGLGAEAYRYDHEFHKYTIYWLPKNFLP